MHNVLAGDSGSSDDYDGENCYQTHIGAEAIETAALKAIESLYELSGRSALSNITGARIIDPENPDSPYEILKKGKWLVDETGKRLEEKLKLPGYFRQASPS